MPTRNINLTPQQDKFVSRVVKSGEYQNASEAVRDALRALQQRRHEDQLKLKALRAHLDEGIAQLDAGQFTELEPAEVRGWLRKLGRRRTKRTR